METKINSALSLLTLLPEGKVENDVRFAETAVTGVCTVYAKRSDNDNEFLLRTIGVAALDGNNLTEAVRIATEGAYISAMSQIAGVFGSVQPKTQQQKPKQEPAPKPSPEPKQEEKQPTPPPAVNTAEPDDGPPGDEDAPPETEAESIAPPVDLKSIITFPEAVGDSPAESGGSLPFGPGEIVEQKPGGGIEKIEFGGNPQVPDLFDNLPGIAVSGDSDGDDDPEYQKALDMEITIFGKLNACNGWKAGKILAEQPQAIIDFCNRNNDGYDGPKYTGPRTDQKEALFTLYPDAVRKVNKAA